MTTLTPEEWATVDLANLKFFMMRSECTTEHLEVSYTEADVQSWIDTLVGTPNQN